MSTILGLDLGEFKSVACAYDTETTSARFTTVPTDPDALRQLLAAERPGLVVFETCTVAGWVADACAERSRPVLESFGAWLEGESKKVLPKSTVGEVIAYARSNWTALTRYLESAHLPIDNTAVENAVRPIALGRKNWLHLGSDRGGHTAATLLSSVQSCRNLGNEPFAYLRDVRDRVSTRPASRIDDLLPDRRVSPAPAGGRKG